MSIRTFAPNGGGGGGAVDSVNGESGTVTLSASDVGADAAGTAVAAVAAHSADTTSVHGISNTAALETTTGSAAKVTTHAGASDPHGDRAFTTSAVSTHAAASDPHGDRAYADSVAEDLLPLAGGTVTGPVEVQDLLTLDRLSMTTPDDQTTLVVLVAPAAGDTDSVTSADLLQVLQGGQPVTWLNENGSVRGQAAKTTEAAARWYGRTGQTADIWQVLDNRTDANVLAAVKANGALEIVGNLTAANYANSAWTVLTSNDGDYTAETSGGTGYEPGFRLAGAAGETVELRGRFNVTNTVNADIFAILPAGARPARTVNVQWGNNAGTAITGSINPSGQLIVNRSVTSAGFVALDGIRFSRVV
ncbi:hypothetical protein [Sphaerisporangium sp. TRM90804]|uniref:hypothetical protein n=1 Tax=Sphaerisporangium sp. TRM90804 TaxID=3031113 RepID=UPI00244A2C07|nr:hypothetical protein [Sphaerisporangium sp. TRM90804]MDH2424765.1 hypothetical protein [Sphaerisporangium sp. TRM90804]